MILVCDNCGDIVKPRYKETLDKMMNSLCLKCSEGSLKLEETELVRREDAEDQIQELNSMWANRLENAVRQERRRILKLVQRHVSKIKNHMNIDEDDDAAYWLNLLKRELEEELRGEAENQDNESFGETT